MGRNMGLSNGVAVDSPSERLEQLDTALISSSTKWRLAELSQLKADLDEGCKITSALEKILGSKLKDT